MTLDNTTSFSKTGETPYYIGTQKVEAISSEHVILVLVFNLLERKNGWVWLFFTWIYALSLILRSWREQLSWRILQILVVSLMEGAAGAGRGVSWWSFHSYMHACLHHQATASQLLGDIRGTIILVHTWHCPCKTQLSPQWFSLCLVKWVTEKKKCVKEKRRCVY